MNNPSDEIKSRLDIVDVLREYIQLKPAGVNFRTNCPFHREKTPSFIVSPEKQIWHCFGCNKGGDIFTFVMEMEGLTFVEALRHLAPKAGVELKRGGDPNLASKRNRLLDIVKLAVDFYHKFLLESPAAAAARAYLAKRGFTAETIENWKLGFSPDSWDSLLNFLKGKGFSEDEIFLAGMSVKKDGRPGFYDRFRARTMFPINDVSGNPVTFTARVSPEREATEPMGKYVNGPQTMIYDKSKILFGLDKAKGEIKKQEQAVIVEGQADAITAHQHGFANVVASSGTALTRDQVALVKRYTQNLFLSFDMDSAGEAAVERGTREALSAEMNVRVIELPSGKDPDECIKNDPEEWKLALKDAKPVMQYHFDKTLGGLDLSLVENKRLAAKKLLPVIAQLGNKIERESWLKKLSQTIDVSEPILRETLETAVRSDRQKGARAGEATAPAPAQARLTREELISELLLALLLKFSEHIDYVLNSLSADQLVGEQNKALYRNLLIYYNTIIDKSDSVSENPVDQAESVDRKINSVDYKDFRGWLAEESGEPSINLSFETSADVSAQPNNNSLPALLDRLALLAEKDFYAFTGDEAKSEIVKAARSLKKHYLANRLKEIEKLIGESEKAGEREQVKELMTEFQIIIDELKEIEQ